MFVCLFVLFALIVANSVLRCSRLFVRICSVQCHGGYTRPCGRGTPGTAGRELPGDFLGFRIVWKVSIVLNHDRCIDQARASASDPDTLEAFPLCLSFHCSLLAPALLKTVTEVVCLCLYACVRAFFSSHRHPFLLPNLALAILALVFLPLVLIYLPETLHMVDMSSARVVART